MGVRQLERQINSFYYERLLSTSDKYKDEVKDEINKEKNDNIKDFIKNPILIKNKFKEDISEKMLKRLILEDIDNFLLELGEGFSYIKNEYKIR